MIFINFKKIKIFFGIVMMFVVANFSYGATVSVDASKLVATANLEISPRSGSFVEGSIIEVPIIVNTNGNVINGVDVKLNFDRNKLSIIKPSSGKSIIGVWVEPPSYDNTRGIASYVGVIPEGIKTSSGLIGTVTFKVLQTGRATISISSDSKVLLNDGIGTEAVVNFGRADYDVISKPPEGVLVFSETHPIENNWYNNKNPIIYWEGDKGTEGFSFEIDNKPFTVPDNTIDSKENRTAFENVSDGLWHFHIKPLRNGVWGNTTHFAVRIDTAPPADFKPKVNYTLANIAIIEKALVSFFTTDALSGVDYYELGIIDKKVGGTEAPVFVQSESPFQINLPEDSKLRVVVRAVDRAGNIKDSFVDLEPPTLLNKIIKDYSLYILIGLFIISLLSLIIHYLVGHHILRYIKRAIFLVKKEEKEELVHKYQEELKEEKKENISDTNKQSDNLPPNINSFS